MIDRVFEMLRNCGGSETAILPPTLLYNEGWLLRLALDWFEHHPGVSRPMSVPPGAHWYSEALLPTRFKATKLGEPNAESRTHADAVVGHVSLEPHTARGLVLNSGATHFVVLEAKLRSGLSPGTRNAPRYGQAARNVACMAEAIAVSDSPLPPAEMAALGFYVVAPEKQITKARIDKALMPAAIRDAVADRVVAYADPAYTRWFDAWFKPMLDCMTIDVISWEGVAEKIGGADADDGAAFESFYRRCLLHSGLAEDVQVASQRRPRSGREVREGDVALPESDDGVSVSSVVCGVDGCPAGWVVVWLDLKNDRMRWEVKPRLEDIAGATPRPAVIGIDVPIGLLESGARECDLLARSRLGFPRSASVFPAPIRPVLAASSHAEASAIRKVVDGKGMSVQAWGIAPKVREADEALRADVYLRGLVREVHPELCFAGMNGGRPMAHSKKSAAGREERITVLGAEFGARIDEALASKPRGCGVDDLLDAFACAWTAARVASGQAEVIPADPSRDEYGLPMEMVI